MKKYEPLKTFKNYSNIWQIVKEFPEQDGYWAEVQSGPDFETSITIYKIREETEAEREEREIKDLIQKKQVRIHILKDTIRRRINSHQTWTDFNLELRQLNSEVEELWLKINKLNS